jgi:hypothetical protein
MALDEKIRNLLTINVHNGVIIEAAKATMTIEQKIAQLESTGMSLDSIREIVLNDFISENPTYFGEYRNAVKDLITDAMSQAYETGVVSEYDKAFSQQDMFAWKNHEEAGQGGEVCEDCAGRDGETQTLEYWKIVGLPKMGFSRCGLNCRCSITPVKEVVGMNI